MKLFTGLKLTAALVMTLSAFLAVHAPAQKVVAHEQKNDKAKTAVYSYTAQPGDSYTKMARKAIQTYGLTNKIDIGQAGIIYAETNLTRAAGSPELNEGQKVEIKAEDVHQWADKAKSLTDAQKAAWNYYVQFVNFNTNNVGQSS